MLVIVRLEHIHPEITSEVSPYGVNVVGVVLSVVVLDQEGFALNTIVVCLILERWKQNFSFQLACNAIFCK